MLLLTFFHVLFIVELWLKGRGALAGQELIKQASWRPIANSTITKTELRVVLCATCNLGVNLCKELSLFLDAPHILVVLLSTIYNSKAFVIFAATTAIYGLVTLIRMVVLLSSPFIQHRYIVGEVLDTHLTLVDGLEYGFGKEFVFHLL